MPTFHKSGRRTESEEGFVLLAVIFLTVLILIALAVAAPKVARSIQRDKELELVHRGEQYKRAIKLYYKKFGAYPTTIDQLVNTNNIRFLRKRYKDPITGKDDWRLIYLGQAKVPPMGLFGQPLTGLPGPTGAVTANAAGGAGAAAPTDASAFGTTSVDTPDTSVTNYSSDDGSEQPETSASSDTKPSVTFTEAAPTPTGAPTPAGTASSAFGTSTGDNNGPTLGGGPIVGVGIPVAKASLILYKKQKRYNQWEFVYNPLEDQLQALGVTGAVQSPNGNGTTPGATTPGTPTNGVGVTQGGTGTGSGTTPTPPSSDPVQQ